MKRDADHTFNVGAGGARSLDGWHAALELGARGVWMGGTRLWSWGPAVLDGTKTKIQLHWYLYGIKAQIQHQPHHVHTIRIYLYIYTHTFRLKNAHIATSITFQPAWLL